MLRPTVSKTSTVIRPLRASFSTTARVMSEGATGAPPSQGGSGNAFQRREKASEDYAIREREKEKLLQLREKVREQQRHLQNLSDHIDEITKNQGGEQN